MPQTTLEWRRDATEEELRNRATEMKSEWAELSTSDRESDTYRSAKAQFLTEMDDIDINLSLRAIEQTPEILRGRGVPAGAGAIGSDGAELRSPGELVVADEGFMDWAKRAAQRGSQIGESPSVSMRTIMTGHELRTLVAEGAGDGHTLLPVGQPYLANVRRQRLFIRDLLTVMQTTLSAIPYVREKNAASNQNSASTVAENTLKPEATVEFTPDIAPTQVIADTIPITTQILEDATLLVGYINGRLVYMLKYREEAEILKGNGITPDLKGILSYSEIQTQATAGAGEYAITIGNAIAKIELVDGYADGVAMNPATYWSMVTHRAAAGSGTFDAQAFTNAPLQYVWGLPVVRTNSLVANQNLVGNFAMGATLFDRSQANVRVFEQHADYAAYNKVLLRAEERVALAVNRPDFFCVATTS